MTDDGGQTRKDECDGGFACLAPTHIEGCFTGEGHPDAIPAGVVETVVALREERDRYRAAIREAMDTMAPCTDAELGEGGIARKAYADLYCAYFSIPADTYRSAL